MALDICTGLFEDDRGALAERMDAPHDAHETARTVGTVWARDVVDKIVDR